MLLFSPVVTALATYNAVVYGFTYLLFSIFSDFFEGQYNFSQARLGLVYLGLAIGFLISLSIDSYANDATHARLTKLLDIWAIAIPAGLIFYGWTAEKRVDSVVPIVATGLVGILFNVYMIDAYTKYAASAIAAGNILRSMSAALLPLVGIPLYDRLGYGWGNTLLAFISLGLGGMFFLIRKYGEEWRNKFAIQFD
ncbi:uncharacterized protein N7483_007461 [Penicillium malachiteum]|uniref:uncharacterized protein n=1 Tax=Penicillium malachiteum TaxID=1324776 RepID=UPI002546D0CD|nr:uncharacterized protein N7483_007461 [Penicillium malachiteum]KAJ5726104.1 hypothetical protein N7483_007461 [Penicillium malachiteum]